MEGIKSSPYFIIYRELFPVFSCKIYKNMTIPKETTEAFVAGDLKAFEEVYKGTFKAIYQLVYRMTNDRQDAEDLTHDIYVRAYEKRALYKNDRSALSTWLYRIAVNFTLNALRSRKRWAKESFIDNMGVAEVLIENLGDSELMEELLKLLNPDFKACLIMREVEERPYDEIADMLKISIGTVRSRINRGRSQLKKLFKERTRR
jgi:RNA polymerase sigma-70 factor, ECF subfamily